MSELSASPMQLGHTTHVLELMRLYCEEVGDAFDHHARTASLRDLHTASRGVVYVLSVEGRVVGYAAIGFGFSFEFGGSDAFLDELYLETDFRGGVLSRLLPVIESEVRHLGASALHLEVLRANPRLVQYYETLGFENRSRYHLMSKRLD
ncbi:MAG: GNAT family N-acetyltransferase [Pseudomonadota bacterium]